jgi:hypothetical protein
MDHSAKSASESRILLQALPILHAAAPRLDSTSGHFSGHYRI